MNYKSTLAQAWKHIYKNPPNPSQHHQIDLMLVHMTMALQIPLADPSIPRLPQLLCDLTHLHLQNPLNISRQLSVVPITRHIRLQVPTTPSTPISVERDIRSCMPTSRPVHTRFLAQTRGQIRSELVVRDNRGNFHLRQISKPITRQDRRLEIRAAISPIVLFPQALSMLRAHRCALQRQRIKPIKRKPAALVVSCRHHHRVGVLVDPLADELHHVVVHDDIVEVGGGIVGVTRVVDSRGFDHEEVAAERPFGCAVEGGQGGFDHFEEGGLLFGGLLAVDLVHHLVYESHESKAVGIWEVAYHR